MSKKTKKKESVRDYTDQELAEMRSKMEAYYEKEIPFVTLQSKYESLIADVEEHKTRRVMAIAQAAQVYAAMNPPEPSEKPNKNG